jgi:hypothetical protein
MNGLQSIVRWEMVRLEFSTLKAAELTPILESVDLAIRLGRVLELTERHCDEGCLGGSGAGY